MASQVQLIIPTTINVLTAINDAILLNRFRGQDGAIALPDLQERAQLLVSEAGLLPIQQAVAPAPNPFTE